MGRPCLRRSGAGSAPQCRYKSDVGMHRCVGLGVIADNLDNIGRAMKKEAAP